MLLSVRSFIIGLLLVISAWIGYSTYCYFVIASQPQCTISGISSGSTYAGDISCTIYASHEYKIAEISVWLDNKPLIEHYKINKSRCAHSFVLATTALPDGPHVLKIQLTDGTYRSNTITQEIPFIVDNVVLQAALIKPTGECRVFQGRTLHVQVQVNKEIKQATVNALSRVYDCFPESPGSTIYECFIPVPCEEAPNEYLYTIHIADHVNNKITLDNKFQVITFPFKKQVLTLTSKPADLEQYINTEAKELEDAITTVVQQSPQQKLWHGPFYIPVDMKSIATEYGTVRTTQEKGRYAHKALDLIATPKSVVWAPNDGIIVHKHNYEHNSGKTLIIDHGYGLLTLLFHLDTFANVDVGAPIKRGQPVGTVGKSGYATGYHLHWGMQIYDVPIEPMQWTKLNF